MEGFFRSVVDAEDDGDGDNNDDDENDDGDDKEKGSYISYTRRAKFSTTLSVSGSLSTLTFMENCLVELYSLYYASSYQHTFVYVRQLALHLRSALKKRTPNRSEPYTAGSTCTASGCGQPYWQRCARRRRKSRMGARVLLLLLLLPL